MARITARERHRQLAQAAMPEVKRLVKKYGRQAVGNCLAKIHAWEREAKKLNALKSEVASLEKRLHP
jgi:hypothetical protein